MGSANELAAHPCGHGAHHHAPSRACWKAAPYDRLPQPPHLHADLGKPDWDNLGKLACDALNGIAFKDDSQVDMGAVTKRPRSPYGTKPRIDIYIEYFVEEYVKEKK